MKQVNNNSKVGSLFLTSLGGDSSEDEDLIQEEEEGLKNKQAKSRKENSDKFTDVLLSKGGKLVAISTLHPSWRASLNRYQASLMKWSGKRIKFETGEVFHGATKEIYVPPKQKPISETLRKIREANSEKKKDPYVGLKRKDLKKIRFLQFTGKRVKF
jgi:hypothetical protein